MGLSEYGDKPEYRLRVYDLANVEPMPIYWLWPQRIPLGKLTLIAGDPGLGKSFMSLDIAARLSRGYPWPDGGEAPHTRTLILSVEDDLHDTIRPRLDLLNADLTNIRAIDALLESEGGDSKSLGIDEHALLLEQEIILYGANLLILDPILAFMGGVNTHRASDVRAAITPLASVAARTQCSILAIMHLNKKSGEASSVYRLTGSLDLPAAARSVMVVGKHPDDDSVRVLAPVKMNLSEMPASLQYRFLNGKLDWSLGSSQLAADDVLTVLSKDEKSQREQAKDFLIDVLSDAPMLARELWEIAEHHGISKNTLRRAKDELGVCVYQSQLLTGKKGSPGWVWALLPPTQPHA